jgi:hypothetical protein
MSRQQFNSRNNIGKVLTFQKSGSTSSFDPAIAFISGSRRVSWKLYNGTGTTQVAGNSITYTGFTSDTSLRNIEMRGSDFTKINFFSLANDNLFGNLDVSELSSVTIFEIHTNPNLTGITHAPSTSNFTAYYGNDCNLTGNLNLPLSGLGGIFSVYGNQNLTGITHAPSTNNFTTYFAFNCNLKGNLDLSSLSGLGGDFRVLNNPNLTGITHTPSSPVFSIYYAYSCDLKGNHDLSMFPNLGGNLNLAYNPDLTGIILAPSSTNFTTYQVHDCDLPGNLDLSLLSGLGGSFLVYNNPNLTGITHAPSSNNFTTYSVQSCDLRGNHDVSMLKLGGSFNAGNNSGLTSITHSVSTNTFTSYTVNSCNLIGNLDLTSFSGLGGDFSVNSNPNLTGITHTASTRNFGYYRVNNCNLTGTLDLTPLSGFGQNSPIPETTSNSFNFRVDSNINLTNILFPTVTTYFRNKQNITGNGAFVMNACNLDYVDFRPLSGATLTGGTSFGNPIMYLRDNSMTAADVNHILQDFLYNATNNPTGWSNINLDIGGTNANPDAVSGGYDGLAAIATLIGAPYNWTITY